MMQVDIAEQIAALPRGHFRTIVADPPWHYKTWSAVNQTRSAENHYPTMSLAEIKALPVADLAAPDAVLLLWVINPMLPQGLAVMDAWGFRFKTIGFCWAKTTRKTHLSWAPKFNVGLGHWSRANIELCLLGTRGKPKRTDKGVRQLIVSPLREHSRKPDEFFDLAERLSPGPYLELFTRTLRPGWTVCGNEVGKFPSPRVSAVPEFAQKA